MGGAPTFRRGGQDLAVWAESWPKGPPGRASGLLATAHDRRPSRPGAGALIGAPRSYAAECHDRTLGADRNAPGTGAETGSVHRVRGRRRHPPARAGQGVVAARLPRCVRGRPAQPGPADPLRDPQRATRRRRRAHVRALDRPLAAAAPARRAAVLRRHPPRRRRLRPAGVQPVLRARVHQRAGDDRPRRGPGARRRSPAGASARRRRRSLGVQPGAAGRLRRPRRARRGRGGRRRDHRGRRGVDARRSRRPRGRAARPRPGPRGVRPVDVRGDVRRPRDRVDRAALAGRAGDRRQAHGRRPRGVAVPEAPARPADRGRPRPPQRRGVPRLHARLPLLPGRHDHAAGPRAAGRAGPHDGRRGPAPHGLRRGQPDLAVDGRPERRRVDRRWDPRRSRGRRAGVHHDRQPAVAARRRLHGRAWPARSTRDAAAG